MSLRELEVYAPQQVAPLQGGLAIRPALIVERDLHWQPRPFREVER